MKEKNTNKLLLTVCIANTVSMVLVGAGLWGVYGFDFLAPQEIPDKASAIDVIPDKVIEGEIIDSYADEEECNVVTIVEIESAMKQVGEITTVAYKYSGVVVESDCSKFMEWEVGFTRNSIEVDYEGTIRAGYVIEDINFEVNQENKTIMVTLPEVQVFSNVITNQDVQWEDNFFNHIDPDIATDLLEKARKEELDEAVENGLYLQAENNARLTIIGVISELCDYKVTFASNQSEMKRN